MQKINRWYTTFLSLFLLLCMTAVCAQAAPSNAPITGEIESLTVNNDNGIYSSGVMVVGGHEVILPKNLLIDLPANRLTLKQIFDQAPAACVALGESGLAKADRCNTMGSGGNATISANRTTAGNIVAGDVFVQKGVEAVTGQVTFINYDQGYYRLNGAAGSDTTGVMIRLNDPTSRHTIQSGAGCAGGPNCSPDPRFTLDPDNYVNTFTTGYPYCIPSTLSRTFPGLPGISGIPAISAGTTASSGTGTGDLLCPDTNRTHGVINENPVADSRRFAPVIIGDSVTAEGNFETINGTRFLSAHTTTINKALQTRNSPDQPDYLFLEEVFIDGPAFQNQRIRALIIGFTTLAPTDVDFWSLHRDPANNAIHEFPLASVRGCDIAAGAGTCGSQGLGGAAGNNIFRIRYDVDFLLGGNGVKDAKLSPCDHLRSSGRFTVGSCTTMAEQLAILSPMPHEIQARTGHRITNPGLANVTIDINGNAATNGQYLFPFGMNLGGIDMPNFFEIDLNLVNTPTVFEGIPWNLDRRLSPGGCMDNTGATIPCPAGPSTSFALDPFPYSGLDPRTQASLPTGVLSNTTLTATTLSNASNRIFSYVDAALNKFNGNTTVLPYSLGVFPVDPPLFPINATPVLNIFPPITDEDSATTTVGVPALIPVLTNDIAVLGTIDTASVKIATVPPATSATLPSGATVLVNQSGTITYTPAPNFFGTDTFTYTVANNFGSVSLPGTVTVTVAKKPVAVDDTVNTPAKSVIPIDLLANDIAGTSLINLASVITSTPSCGSLVNQNNGTVLFTAPDAVPAAPGTCAFTYYISDISAPALLSNVATVTVTITPAPAPVAGNDTVSATTGSVVTFSVIANDTATAPAAINPATLAVTAATGGSAAANSDGTITYTAPAAPGTYSFSYTVQDNTVTPATSNVATVTATVTGPALLSISTASPLTPYTIGSGAFPSITLAATGGTAPYTWAVAPANTLPAGLALTAGVLTGTPAAAGTFSFSLQVTDNSAPATTISKAFTLVVSPPPLVITAANPLPAYTLGNGAYAAPALTATGGTAPYTWAVAPASTLPAGLTLTGDALSGTPATAGTFNFSLQVTDSQVPAVTNVKAFTLVVSPGVPTGTISINAGAAATRSTAATLTLSAASPNGAVTQMQFSKDGGATWFALENFATTRTVTLLGTQGVNTIWVRFKDAAGILSPAFSDSIIYDTVQPTGTIAVSSPNPTTSATGTLALTATDNQGGSGVTQMQFSTNNGVSFFAREPFATTRNVSLPIIGDNNFTVRFIDAAGNVSGNQSVSITRTP